MWYRRERKETTPEKGGVKKVVEQMNRNTIRKKEYKRRVKEDSAKEIEVKAVIFVQETENGELVNKLRETEEKLAETCGYRIKFVERCGEKLVDILVKSNPWKGEICDREECLICDTKVKTGKGKNQDCSGRNISYETWCADCEKKEIDRVEKEKEETEVAGVNNLGVAERNASNRKEKNTNKGEKGIKLFKYVGETGRSGYERNQEHVRDREKWKISSHMLKHIVETSQRRRRE